MKKAMFLVFFVFTIVNYSQKKSIDLSLSSGISTPSSSFSDQSFATNGSFFELSSSYYFSNFGFGLSVGTYTNPTDSNLDRITNSLDFSTENTTDDWTTTYFGLGPEFKTSFNKIKAVFQVRTGIMAIKPIAIQSSFNDNVDVSIPVYKLTTDKTSKISYFSTAIKIGYGLTQNLNVFATADYLTALSNELTLTESSNLQNLRDTNKNGIIDAEDFIQADGTTIAFNETSSTIKPQTTNFGIGITWSFSQSSKVRKPMQDIKSVTQDQQKKALLDFQKPDKVVENTSRMNKGELTDVIAKGTVVFTNPSKEKADKQKKQRKLVNILPKNNQNFNSENELKKFSWNVIGERIVQPKFVIEISKIDKLRNVWTFVAKTSKPTLSLSEFFNQNSSSKRVSERLRHKDRAVFTDGKYKWKVTETSTGISSSDTYFTMTQCEIDFSISNEEIECLGYNEEGDRTFKICFDTTYSSTSGDLTYLDPSSGLTVFDQTYSTLTYTLVSPNPTLVSQTGATVSTVSYCFEVTVPNSVTSIGFGLQGDDLDPSPIICQPGASALFDDLPSCLCNECEEIELSFDDFNITPNGGTGNQFNFNGNINVNVPIYGIEFQIQSYTYSATPSACTEGVSSIEESGMILMPGTTINGSTSLQLFNEIASGSASSNNNATKNIKYTSNSPLSGPIPVNLTIGLPGPISGLDPSCCVIEYTVCIKVKIFYEEGNCKSCVFTHCFEFNNQ